MYLKFLENYDLYSNVPVKTEMINKNVHFSKHGSISNNYVLMKLNQIDFKLLIFSVLKLAINNSVILTDG